VNRRDPEKRVRPKRQRSQTGPGVSFQSLLLAVQQFWASQKCVLQLPYDVEVGAGTMHPETFFRVLGPDPYRVVYLQPSRRPTDGRYGENPNRLYKHIQLQVILKPAPENVQELYLQSLAAIGIDLKRHDIRFEEDNWEAPTLGAWGIGWQVLLDGLEITQFTYFQQCGGVDLNPVAVELTYGMERIAMFLQEVDSVYDLRWSEDVRYRAIRFAEELDSSIYSFDRADIGALWQHFRLYEGEARNLLQIDGEAPSSTRVPLLAAYDLCLKCSHLFNVLDARRAISTTERAALIGRIRSLACRCAELYLGGQTLRQGQTDQARVSVE
jgi:glycyl-tRNA synthetase alpha chain